MMGGLTLKRGALFAAFVGFGAKLNKQPDRLVEPAARLRALRCPQNYLQSINH